METWLTYGLQDFVLFSSVVYFGLFRQANEAVWPFLLMFPLFGLFIAWAARTGRFQRIGAMLLALAWVSTILLFLKPYYLPINWAVTYAIYAFAAQVLLLLLIAGNSPNDRRRSRTGYSLMAMAIVYPILSLIFGRPINQAEFFALAPDPTVIFTLGYLLQLRGSRAALPLIIPLLWCAFSALTLYALEEPSAAFPAFGAILAVAALVKRAVR